MHSDRATRDRFVNWTSSMVFDAYTLPGKTTFLLYLLLCRLERQLPTAIQFRPDEFVLFSAEGPMVHKTTGSHLPLLSDLWVLTDSNTHVVSPCPAFMDSGVPIIQTTSPQFERRQWATQKRVSTAISDLPTPLEIGAVAYVFPTFISQTILMNSHTERNTAWTLRMPLTLQTSGGLASGRSWISYPSRARGGKKRNTSNA